MEMLKKRFPLLEDRSEHSTHVTCRVSFALADDFDFVCRCIEGEKPSVVLRRLIRAYVDEKSRDLAKRSSGS